jgi:hypothetical protein
MRRFTILKSREKRIRVFTLVEVAQGTMNPTVADLRCTDIKDDALHASALVRHVLVLPSRTTYLNA